MQTKISITGATGDIGGAYLDHVTDTHDVQALIRKGSFDKPSKEKQVKYFEFQDYTYNYKTLMNFTRSCALIHAAAILYEPNSSPQTELIDYIAVNSLLTSLLVSCCMKHRTTPKFVYISTEMVYTLPEYALLEKLSANFKKFCEKTKSSKTQDYDLRDLAGKFIRSNKYFPFHKYNSYVLSKYLGEVAASQIDNAAIVRITNAYGPQYTNPRLIPRSIVARLTGHSVAYSKQKRDFVFSNDIHRLLDAIIDRDITGTIDCKSGMLIDTEDVCKTIIKMTPTAYGELKLLQPEVSTVPPASKNLPDIIGGTTTFDKGLSETIFQHKERCYHKMEDTRALESFLEPDEKIIKQLYGSSAAYLFVVEDKAGNKKVRKVGVRDGVEGNGIAKVANEIKYYEYIKRHKPELARLYPALLNHKTDKSFSSMTIEYLDGPNYYTALKENTLSHKAYRNSMDEFIDKLATQVFDNVSEAKNPDNDLNMYYLERSLSRLNSIASIIPVKETIHINDEKLLSSHIILTDLLQNKKLRKFILPRTRCFCFHGDLTLLNTVFIEDKQEIRLIDPRGSMEDWDPLYDFAKLKFSLSGFGEFIIDPEPMVHTTSKGGYRIDFNRIAPPARYLHEKFFEILENNEQFKGKLLPREPHWRLRIALAEATHYLADIPFRLFTDKTTWSAVSSYVVGTYYLNKAYAELNKMSV